MHTLVASKSIVYIVIGPSSISQVGSSHVISRLFTDVVTVNKSLRGGKAGFNRWFQDLSVPCRHPTPHRGVLLFSTCMHPIGCPAVPWSVQGEQGHLSLVHGLGLGLQSPLFPDLSYPDLAQGKKKDSYK